jgi:hypothetical protein
MGPWGYKTAPKENPATDDNNKQRTTVTANGESSANDINRCVSPSKGARYMHDKMNIVFFDDLGFGWLIDADTLRRIHEKESIEQLLIQRSLAELLRRRKLV